MVLMIIIKLLNNVDTKNVNLVKLVVNAIYKKIKMKKTGLITLKRKVIDVIR